MMMIMRMMSMMIMIKIVNQIEKIVTTIALPDRSEVEELSSDYAQSILDKVFIVIVIISTSSASLSSSSSSSSSP